ncbi:hypothetical protein [Bacillus marasmi]|uniref:hypothetical protein n=1 Tax=Bacillus marasmi TaxID=1926279 RepID=UPI0011CA7F34|nr:hypothetical protein [Bacillus marasmi]
MYENKTIDELLDMEQELLDAEEDENNGIVYMRISIYKALLSKISADKTSEYITSLEKIKTKLISYLIQHGTYLKTVYQKDDHAAESTLKDALKYERHLPIVHYRLGFLNYKKRKFTTALIHFENALKIQTRDNNKQYHLNQQQLYYCHLYLANCGLFIAQNAQRSLDELELNVKPNVIQKYETSSLFHLIKHNEALIEKHGYQIITNEGSRYCSLEECEAAFERNNTMILDLTKRENIISYNQKDKPLSKNQVELLRFLLLKSNLDTPITKHDVYDLFNNADENGEIPTNTYIQNITRLNQRLSNAGIPIKVIENKPDHQETAYYYNQLIPFIIIHRSDDNFILG